MVDTETQSVLERRKKKQSFLVVLVLSVFIFLGFVLLYKSFVWYQKSSESASELKESVGVGSSSAEVPLTIQTPQGEVLESEEVVVDTSTEVGSKSEVPFVPLTPSVPVTPIKLDYSFGISLGGTLSVADESVLVRTLDTLKALRVGWIRVDLAWSSIQPTNSSTYHWEPFDRIVREANKRGIRVLPILTYTPSWARAEPCVTSSKCPPANPEEFAEFARVAVARYAPQGVYVWEVWNEPNLNKFWASGASYARYTELLKLTYTAIHKEDAEAVVLSGGLAPTGTGGGSITAREFLEGMYEYGAKNYFDAVAFHPYAFPLGPRDVKTTNAWSQMVETEWNLRGIMREHGDAHKKIWLTEYGAPTGGPGSIASNSVHAPWSIPDHVTEAYQAELLQQAVEAQNSYDWAGPLFWYSYQDLGTSENTIENFFGIIRYDGTQKPAYLMIERLLK